MKGKQDNGQKELAETISKQTSGTVKASMETPKAFTDMAADALSKGDDVRLVGFGSFETRQRAERKGKNPATGEEILIPAANVPAFKPGKALKKALM